MCTFHQVHEILSSVSSVHTQMRMYAHVNARTQSQLGIEFHSPAEVGSSQWKFMP